MSNRPSFARVSVWQSSAWAIIPRPKIWHRVWGTGNLRDNAYASALATYARIQTLSRDSYTCVNTRVKKRTCCTTISPAWHTARHGQISRTRCTPLKGRRREGVLRNWTNPPEYTHVKQRGSLARNAREYRRETTQFHN